MVDLGIGSRLVVPGRTAVVGAASSGVLAGLGRPMVESGRTAVSGMVPSYSCRRIFSDFFEELLKNGIYKLQNLRWLF